MEHADKILSTIGTYLEANDLFEDELSLFIQLDFDDENNDFRIDYTLTSHEKEEAMTIDTGFWYETLPEAWENYVDQIGEVNQNYPTANIRHPHPEEYKGGKIGGNPVMSIRDAESDIWMDYDFFREFMEEKDQVDVDKKDLETFSHSDDIDVWYEIIFNLDEKRYRVRIKELDGSRGNFYELCIAESQPLNLEDGYTHFRRKNEENYSSLNDYGIEFKLREFLESETNVEFEDLQERLG